MSLRSSRHTSGTPRIRRAGRIQRVHNPPHEGLERLTRYRRHERNVHRGLLSRARPRLRLPVLRLVFPVGGLQLTPGLDEPRRRVRRGPIRGTSVCYTPLAS
jgi:hypothetical protein